jgi:hypothetical protein
MDLRPAIRGQAYVESPGTMLLVRIFRVVSPWEPVVMRLHCDRHLHENTARAQIIDKGECAGIYRRGGMVMLTEHPQLIGRV